MLADGRGALRLAVAFGLAGCGATSASDEASPSLSFAVGFTTNQHGGPEPSCTRPICRRLLELIESSERSIDFAVYGIRGQATVVRALQAAERRGVRVRGVVDAEDDHCNGLEYPDTARLIAALSPGSVRCDAGPDARAIMHNKFFVFDRRRIWTGSTNLSDTELSGEYNTDVAVVIDSTDLAGVYTRELEEMFGGRFHTAKVADTPQPLERVKSYFSPTDAAIDNAVLPLIDGAIHTLDVAMFFFTSELVADALLAAVERGVRVRTILDAEGASNRSSQHGRLCAAGTALKVEDWGGKAHAKWAVADAADRESAAVVFGSMNWTRAGDAINDENTLYVKDAELAARFSAEFEREWTDLAHLPECTPVPPEGPLSRGSCSDGVDNDHDGYADTDDFDCG